MIKTLVALLVSIIIIVAVGLPVILDSQPVTTIENVSCFQDSADVATACGGLDNGTYDFPGWDVYVTNPENTNDEDWATFASDLCQDPPAYYTVVYEVPDNETSAEWNVKYMENGTIYSEDYLLDEDCTLVDGSAYQLEIYADYDENYTCRVFLGCVDGLGMSWFNGDPFFGET